MKSFFVSILLTLGYQNTHAQLGVINPSIGVVTPLGLDTSIGKNNIGNAIIAATPCSAISCTSLVLPLHLLDFWGKKENSFNQLFWKTDGELNVSHYIIERSEDANKFDSLGKIVSLNLFSPYQYNFNDKFPLPQKNYYRLKIVDRDRSFIYSKIILLERIISTQIKLYPNPTNNYVNLDLFAEAANTNYLFEIINESGQALIEIRVLAEKGYNTWALNVAKLASGYYLLKVINKNTTETKHFSFIILH